MVSFNKESFKECFLKYRVFIPDISVKVEKCTRLAHSYIRTHGASLISYGLLPLRSLMSTAIQTVYRMHTRTYANTRSRERSHASSTRENGADFGTKGTVR